MTTNSTAPTWYPTHCPAWCAGKHPALLALNDDPAGAEADAAEVVIHGRDLVTAAGMTVSLAADEAHPDSDQAAATEPRMFVWLPEHHEAEGITANRLRVWAAALATAADTAGQHLNQPPTNGLSDEDAGLLIYLLENHAPRLRDWGDPRQADRCHDLANLIANGQVWAASHAGDDDQ